MLKNAPSVPEPPIQNDGISHHQYGVTPPARTRVSGRLKRAKAVSDRYSEGVSTLADTSKSETLPTALGGCKASCINFMCVIAAQKFFRVVVQKSVTVIFVDAAIPYLRVVVFDVGLHAEAVADCCEDVVGAVEADHEMGGDIEAVITVVWKASWFEWHC